MVFAGVGGLGVRGCGWTCPGHCSRSGWAVLFDGTGRKPGWVRRTVVKKRSSPAFEGRLGVYKNVSVRKRRGPKWFSILDA